MQVTLMSYIGDGGGRPVLDSYIETLARLRDEGFRRLWSSQLPTEPDLLTWPRLRSSRVTPEPASRRCFKQSSRSTRTRSRPHRLPCAFSTAERCRLRCSMSWRRCSPLLGLGKRDGLARMRTFVVGACGGPCAQPIGFGGSLHKEANLLRVANQGATVDLATEPAVDRGLAGRRL